MARILRVFVVLCVLPLTSFAREPVKIEINKGQMIRLNEAAASVVVADPTTADVQVVSPRLLFVYGKKVGDTSLFVVDSADQTVFSATISVTHNLSQLNDMAKKIAPDSDVSFKTVDGGLMMSGSTTTLAEAEHLQTLAQSYIGKDQQMVNMTSAGGTDQVTLRVKIVEMSRNDLKKLGINLQASLSPLGAGLQVFQGSDIAFGADGLLNRGGSTSTQIAGTFRPGGATINGVVDALETQGLVNVLAEPTLTTTSGKAASFLAGGEFPIPVKDGNGSITVQYKPFGVSLNFTPVVMTNERMSIEVAPEVSTINFDNPIEVAGIKNPIISTRKAKSTVELGSGDTFVLAGLLKSENSNAINKFPGLGDLPVMGALFRSQQFQNNLTELVILVTPYAVRPIKDASKVQTPLSGIRYPNDMQRLMLGNLYQQEKMEEEKEEAVPVPLKEPVQKAESAPEVLPVEEHETQAEEPLPEPEKSQTPEPALLNGEGGFILP